MSGMRGRGRPGRKEEVEGSMEDASHRAPLPSPSWDAQRGQASLPASTHLADTHWVPLCVSSPGLIGTEAQRVAISLAQYCLALTPKWKGWEHRHSGTTAAPPTLPPAHISPNTSSLVHAGSSVLDAVPCFTFLVTSWLSFWSRIKYHLP